MANAYTVDKLPDRKKKALIKDILAGVPDNKIADNYGLPKNCVTRYRSNKLFQAVAEVWADQKQTVAEGYAEKFEAIAARLTKVLDAIDKELADLNGDYNLADHKKAKAYVKMLNETSRTLQANIKDLAVIQGDIKDTAMTQNRPTIILAQIAQIIEQSTGSKEDILARLKNLRQTE